MKCVWDCARLTKNNVLMNTFIHAQFLLSLVLLMLNITGGFQLHHYRLISSFLFSAQVPLGVVVGAALVRGDWVLLAGGTSILTLMELGAWEFWDKSLKANGAKI